MKPIEPGCLAWWVGSKGFGGTLDGCVVKVLRRSERIEMPNSPCPACGRKFFGWLCHGLPRGHGTCQCLLIRIDPDDNIRAEVEEQEKVAG